jgi:hypothetical protein
MSANGARQPGAVWPRPPEPGDDSGAGSQQAQQQQQQQLRPQPPRDAAEAVPGC